MVQSLSASRNDFEEASRPLVQPQCLPFRRVFLQSPLAANSPNNDQFRNVWSAPISERRQKRTRIPDRAEITAAN